MPPPPSSVHLVPNPTQGRLCFRRRFCSNPVRFYAHDSKATYLSSAVDSFPGDCLVAQSTMLRLQDGRSQFASDRHAYALAASAALGSIFYGWDIGLIGGILSMASFQKYFGLDKQSQKDRDNLSGNIVSVLQAGCLCVSCLGSGFLRAAVLIAWLQFWCSIHWLRCGTLRAQTVSHCRGHYLHCGVPHPNCRRTAHVAIDRTQLTL
jgi:hypothetical protein